MKRSELLFIGGDKRRLYTEKYLISKGYKTVSYEENPDLFFKKLKNEKSAVILPLPFTRDGENLNIPESSEKISIKEFLSYLKKGDKVVGGLLTKDFLAELSKIGAVGCEYYCEDLILENAELTADAVFTVFSENDIDIFSKKTALLGFGRTAKALAVRLSQKGIDFSVVARSKSAENDAVSMNYDFVKLNSFTEEIQEFDIILNTVPALILDENLLRKAKNNVTVVDIASAPFGIEKSVAEKYNVKLIRALGLPGKYYPEKAGELIAKKAESLL